MKKKRILAIVIWTVLISIIVLSILLRKNEGDRIIASHINVTVVKIDFPTLQSDYIEFCYQLNSKTICRLQEVKDSNAIPRVSEYVVKYRKDRPDIAYIVDAKTGIAP